MIKLGLLSPKFSVQVISTTASQENPIEGGLNNLLFPGNAVSQSLFSTLMAPRALQCLCCAHPRGECQDGYSSSERDIWTQPCPQDIKGAHLPHEFFRSKEALPGNPRSSQQTFPLRPLVEIESYSFSKPHTGKVNGIIIIGNLIEQGIYIERLPP